MTDPLTKTQPTPAQQPLEESQYIYVGKSGPPEREYRAAPPKRRRWGCCLFPALLLAVVVALLIPYLLLPGRTNVLLLGIDSRDPGSNLGRTDTMVLTSFLPMKPYVGMVSIPRDLWITLPAQQQAAYGSANRINAPHYFAELDQPGTGGLAAMQAVRDNFGVDVDFYVRVRFEGIRQVVDALGGVEITLDQPMAGYEAGTHRLDGAAALAFVRDRRGSTDLRRNERGQIFLKAVAAHCLKPQTWPRLPLAWIAVYQVVDTDVPAWQWPRLGIALLRVGVSGIDGRTFTPEMVNPFTTEGGAQVLGPVWEQINPMLFEVFGQ
jgi:LCP family protein required for cell wall assembly